MDLYVQDQSFQQKINRQIKHWGSITFNDEWYVTDVGRRW